MSTSEKTFRKTNPLLGTGLSIAFIALGLYLYFVKAEEPGNTNATIIKIAGAANVLFFGGLLLFAIIKKARKN